MDHCGNEKLADWEKELLGVRQDPAQALRDRVRDLDTQINGLHRRIGQRVCEGRDYAALITEAQVAVAKRVAYLDALDLIG